MTLSLLRDPSLFRTSALIGGAWVGAAAGGTIDVTNPATGERLGTVPDLGADDTRDAVAAAAAAWQDWRATPAPVRADRLMAWYDAVLAAADDLALILTLEQGKPLAEARGEVLYGAGFIRWFAEEARRIGGASVPAPTSDRRILVLKEPVGVSAAITPWNFPIAMITRKAAPALAAGCTVVIKPSELTPFSALALAVLAERVGIPPGVVNVVTGAPGTVGGVLTSDIRVRKLSFTGSTAVGRLLMAQCAATVKRVSLELGGNAPFIVFDDADLDLAVAGAVASKFRNAGQTCVCANRILVQDGIHDRFVAALASAAAGFRLGDGRDAGVTMGPLINAAARAKVMAHLADAQTKGGRLQTPGGTDRGGSFVAPAVLTGATPEMQLAHEETFGPLAPVFRFRSEAEALDLANATPFGLAAYFYTADLRRSWRVAERLEAGMVGLNTGSVSLEMAPFGGIKQSGIGREGSSLGIEEYLEAKAFHIGGLQ
ncbi:NAD-dependent succinate-semialdehyde dehydrogenase [Lichenihabitans sp. Uapishka_5]|uniref:NAD-dependent succinate-semialdehyde dehydrogenase n=1 Tax=Lichenihabitans sp. Uapishka_5 TaxID=3037302 RepID=UPI0029E8092B|nr:NAD-dependent succinate-semialdehyde dehydrogenase [Lichenihabitans sp. Uapishka_5]MDX7950539.1 NAD-dependent succinate-semialdehyde dehydrogenase [Lichenihabitans sp. Uapishka_5]